MKKVLFIVFIVLITTSNPSALTAKSSMASDSISISHSLSGWDISGIIGFIIFMVLLILFAMGFFTPKITLKGKRAHSVTKKQRQNLKTN